MYSLALQLCGIGGCHRAWKLVISFRSRRGVWLGNQLAAAACNITKEGAMKIANARSNKNDFTVRLEGDKLKRNAQRDGCLHQRGIFKFL